MRLATHLDVFTAIRLYFLHMNDVRRVIVMDDKSVSGRMSAQMTTIRDNRYVVIAFSRVIFNRLAKVVSALPDDYFAVDSSLTTCSGDRGGVEMIYRLSDVAVDDRGEKIGDDGEQKNEAVTALDLRERYDRSLLIVLFIHLCEMRILDDLLSEYPTYVTVSALLTGNRLIRNPFDVSYVYRKV